MSIRTASSAARRAALAVLVPIVGCVTVEFPGGPPQPLVETVVHGEAGSKILLVQIDGVISEEPEGASLFSQGESRVARLREELDKAREDDAIRALLVRINSPGGTVTASDIIYREILRFKEEQGVPVIAHLMGIAASGGYYTAMAADRVVAQPTTVTGSIGVIFGSVNLAGLMEKVGVENQTLVSGPYKDAGSILRKMSPDERAQLQSVLDDMYQRFLSVVGHGRPDLPAEVVTRLADGRIYSADQALEHGLVDQLGDLTDAVAAAEQSAGLDASRVVTYHRPREYRKNLYSVESAADRFAVDWRPEWRSLLPSPAFLYLWTPGLRE
jgi:protease-4